MAVSTSKEGKKNQWRMMKMIFSTRVDGKNFINDNKRLEISFINGVWIDQKLKLEPSFQETISTIYKAESKTLDFCKKAAIDKVNSWVKKETKGLIRAILPNELPRDSIKVVVANAIYFSGDWLEPFKKVNTKDDKFHLLNQKVVEAPFMCMRSTMFSHGSYDGFQVLKLPYEHGNDKRRFSMYLPYEHGNDKRRFSMYIFLPDEKDGLPDLIKKFNSNSEFFNQSFEGKLKIIDILKIPKFKFSIDIKVSDTLSKLGLHLNPKDIEMVVPNGDGDRIDVFHKVYIDVNERGTEAAAVAAGIMCGCARNPPPPFLFIADHPFMFMIREEMSGIPFFIGAVLNPLLD
ncbi:Serpin-ZX like [Quillaja saponaria]|nr:Serpin-ZX like [Quillaja saponaria]